MGEPPGVGTQNKQLAGAGSTASVSGGSPTRVGARDGLFPATDWVFPSIKLKGKRPRVANMLVSDHLRPAAVKAGVLAEGDPVRFGFHNLRHSLASFLVRTKTDIKTVQPLLRHANVTTTLGLYAHSIDETKLAAQGGVLAAILQTPISGAVN